jgi:hypothetical protein
LPLFVLLIAVLTTVSAQGQTEDPKDTVQETVDQRQQTQGIEDNWSDEKAELVRRYRAAEASVHWLRQQRDEESARDQALADHVGELQRRLVEAGRLESSIQDTLTTIVAHLEASMAEGLPFLPEERQMRLATLKNDLVQPDASAAEKLRRVLEALQVEASYGTTVEVYQESVSVDGQDIHVDILRLGRLSLFWRTPDGSRAGIFDPATGQWLELSGKANRNIGIAMEMASRMRPVSLIDLPLGRITP